MTPRSALPVHKSVKIALGYDPADHDATVLKDWQERKRRVCKPCWELKYCPYGPFVEQSPFLPPLRSEKIAHMKYFEECLRTQLVGNVLTLGPEERKQYEEWLADEELILRQAVTEFEQLRRHAYASQHPDRESQIQAWLGDPLPPIHIYRAPFEIEVANAPAEADFSSEEWAQIRALADEIRRKYQEGLRSGAMDHRKPLEPVRAAWFETQLTTFDPDNYPESIPDTFSDANCNVFGHICPVFFAAEALTETREPRRIGRRQIPFATMMRIVRRDDYRCQHCKKKLRDDEVEFDHKIPVSKGGSSEEHNLRLTCFDCNRDKSDEYIP